MISMDSSDIFQCEALANEIEALFFFFQAEDGIRDHCVTGVQTCALPISGAISCTTNLSCVWSGATDPDGVLGTRGDRARKGDAPPRLRRTRTAIGRSTDRKSVV